MKTVKFNEKGAGKWAENNTTIPQFTVEAGEEHDVSDELAEIIVGAGKGKIVEKKAEKTPPADDKAKAEKKAPADDKSKSENKSDK